MVMRHAQMKDMAKNKYMLIPFKSTYYVIFSPHRDLAKVNGLTRI